MDLRPPRCPRCSKCNLIITAHKSYHCPRCSYEFFKDYQLIIDALKDPYEPIQKIALNSLKNQKFEGILPYLVNIINSNREINIKIDAIYCLKNYENSISFNLLKAIILNESDAEIKIAAINTLWYFVHYDVTELLLFSLKNCNINIRLSAMNAVNNFNNPRIITEIKQILFSRDCSRKEKISCIQALKRSNEIDLLNILIPLIDDSDKEIQKLSIIALGKNQNLKAVQPFLNFINSSSDNSLKCDALKSLKIIGDLSIIPEIFKYTYDSDVCIQNEIFEILTYNVNEETWKYFLTIFNSNVNLTLKESALTYLSTGNYEIADQVLNICLYDKERRLRLKAISALQHYNCLIERLFEFIKSEDDIEIRHFALNLLITTNHSSAIEASAYCLNDLSSQVRCSALQYLKEIKCSVFIEKFYNLAKEDADVTIRKKALELLLLIGEKDADNAIKIGLCDPNPKIRSYAILNIQNFQELEIQEKYLGIIKNDDNIYVRKLAFDKLNFFDNNVIIKGYLIGLNDNNLRLVIHSIKKLGEIKALDAVDPLIYLVSLTYNNEIRQNAINALGKIGDSKAINILLKMLKSSNQAIQESAINALGKIGDSKAIIPIQQMAFRGNFRTRICAIRCLPKFNCQKSLDAILELYTSRKNFKNLKIQHEINIALIKIRNSINSHD